MAAFAPLWEHWHARQYEKAVGEVCRLVAVEETLPPDVSDVLAAAGSVASESCVEGRAWSEEDRSVALLGRNCCNRLAERHLRGGNWLEAARWCALAWRLEGDSSCANLWLEDGSWAAARYQRLFHAAEVLRLAGKGQRASHPSRPSYLQTSRKCLEACEETLQRHASGTWRERA